MADIAVLPRPAEATLGGLKLTPQESSDVLVEHLKADSVDQPDKLARDLAAKLPLKEQVSTSVLRFDMNKALTSAFSGLSLGRC